MAQLGALEAFFILVLVPASVALGFFRAIWPIMIGEILFLHTAILISFHWTHRKVFAGDYVPERREALISMALYPIASARAIDALARHMFHDISAPYAASIAMHKADLASYLRNTFFDAECQKVRLPDGFREEHYKTAMEPPEWDSLSQSFCPRCHTQFVHQEGTCSDCQAHLVAFTPRG